MNVRRVYIDTSVIGGCFDSEFLLWSNGLMKDFRLGTFTPVVSEVVAAEIADAPQRIRDKYAELLALEPDLIEVNPEALELADAYQNQQVLSPKFYDDGLHISIATVAEVDVLVSWNFKHIVHLDKISQFNAVNLELGYKPLQIYSPREVTNFEEELLP